MFSATPKLNNHKYSVPAIKIRRKKEMAHIRRNLNGVGKRSKTARVEGDHVEDVDTLHAPKELETLDTSRLLLIRRERLGGLVVARPVELGCNRTVVLVGTALCGHREGARGGANDARPRGGGRCGADGLDGAKHGCRLCVCWTMDETQTVSNSLQVPRTIPAPS